MPLFDFLKDRKPDCKVLLLGSGGLSIGQAGEFDYSGTQAVKALEEEGIEVIIVNPNIATVQTDPHPNRKVYLYPVEPRWVKKVIATEKPHGIMAGFGGQTALNCLIELSDSGVLEEHNVVNLGTAVETLKMSEDRQLFADKMKEIGLPVATSQAVNTVEDAVQVAKSIGYPVMLRSAYALGGLGSGIVADEQQLKTRAENALSRSPQILVEKSLFGWKEVEYEVMRDKEGNCITICNMENMDPMGIHTGDSIVVAPSQSLSDDEYQLLRNASLKIVNELKVIGECNVQFALNPKALEFFVIEMNARLSRSSALASKASGYPIAYIAAKVVCGFDLLELKNPLTQVNKAFFEPAFDYLTIKIPRWDLQKFGQVNPRLGSTMKSVGEIMAIGRSFAETLQKAVRMVLEDERGISAPISQPPDLEDAIQFGTHTRIFDIVTAFRQGYSVEKIHELSRIDSWFLQRIEEIVQIEMEIANKISTPLEEINQQDLEIWKKFGFSDRQIAETWSGNSTDDILELTGQVRAIRKQNEVTPLVKKIDTTAGEYPSKSNYFYWTYWGDCHDVENPLDSSQSALILGSGAYRIGTSVEFDWCAVSCSRELKLKDWRSVILNCNPETVSTDFNLSDRLYFDEMSGERILDILELEKVGGVIVAMGGQAANNLTVFLAKAGVRLFGHSAEAIRRAEDREQFSSLLDQLGIDQPDWAAATSEKQIQEFKLRTGFPLLLRPSKVLSGAAMNVVEDDDALEDCLERASEVSIDAPAVVSQFLNDATELEMDGVAQQGEIIAKVVSEHIEHAGVHSGDSTLVVPAQNVLQSVKLQAIDAAEKIVKELGLNGPFNIQFLVTREKVKVIECNARASRSFPFVSKVTGTNLMKISVGVLTGEQSEKIEIARDDYPFVGVKSPMFSFSRLEGSDSVLGVEMMSTGEVGCIGVEMEEALLLALESTNIRIPKVGILISSGPERDKFRFLSVIETLKTLAAPLYATPGTAEHLHKFGHDVIPVGWPGESKPDVLDLILRDQVDLVINIPKNLKAKELENGRIVRQAAIRKNCSLMTNMELVVRFMVAVSEFRNFYHQHQLVSLPPYTN